jgi:uncharacterized protein
MANLIAFVLIALFTGVAAPAAAGPLEDADAAAQRGDYSTALRLRRSLSEQGDAQAQFRLGIMYATGTGVAQDRVEAVKWYRKAAEQGYPLAQLLLGKNYTVLQDYAEAAKWYRKASEQGYAPAQYELGLVYEAGAGVPQDYVEAAKWYRRAAEQNDEAAQYNLGMLYVEGHGVAQDYVQAHLWFDLASRGDYKSTRDGEYVTAAHSRDELEKKMSPQQIFEARKLALEWRSKKN